MPRFVRPFVLLLLLAPALAPIGAADCSTSSQSTPEVGDAQARADRWTCENDDGSRGNGTDARVTRDGGMVLFVRHFDTRQPAGYDGEVGWQWTQVFVRPGDGLPYVNVMRQAYSEKDGSGACSGYTALVTSTPAGHRVDMVPGDACTETPALP